MSVFPSPSSIPNRFSPRHTPANFNPIGNWQHWHWQHFHIGNTPAPARWGERTRLRALRVAFGNVPSEASPLRCMSSASRHLVFTSPMTSPLAQFFQWTKATEKDLMSSLHICTHRYHPQTTMATVHLNFHQHRLIRQCHQPQIRPAQRSD